jgi:hypothetical protein
MLDEERIRPPAQVEIGRVHAPTLPRAGASPHIP